MSQRYAWPVQKGTRIEARGRFWPPEQAASVAFEDRLEVWIGAKYFRFRGPGRLQLTVGTPDAGIPHRLDVQAEAVEPPSCPGIRKPDPPRGKR